MASAMMLPISVSPLAEIVATCMICARSLTSLESLLQLLDHAVHGLLDPALDVHRVRSRR